MEKFPLQTKIFYPLLLCKILFLLLLNSSLIFAQRPPILKLMKILPSTACQRRGIGTTPSPLFIEKMKLQLEEIKEWIAPSTITLEQTEVSWGPQQQFTNKAVALDTLTREKSSLVQTMIKMYDLENRETGKRCLRNFCTNYSKSLHLTLALRGVDSRVTHAMGLRQIRTGSNLARVRDHSYVTLITKLNEEIILDPTLGQFLPQFNLSGDHMYRESQLYMGDLDHLFKITPADLHLVFTGTPSNYIFDGPARVHADYRQEVLAQACGKKPCLGKGSLQLAKFIRDREILLNPEILN